MKKLICLVALAAITFGSVYAHGTPNKVNTAMQTDTTKKKKKTMKKDSTKKKDTTNMKMQKPIGH